MWISSVLLALFDAEAERRVVAAQIAKAETGDTPAATWLWDRKYGRVKDQVEATADVLIRVRYENS